MDRYSVRCHLATEKEAYFSSIPVAFGPVDDLPLCPSAGEHIHVYVYCRVSVKLVAS